MQAGQLEEPQQQQPVKQQPVKQQPRQQQQQQQHEQQHLGTDGVVEFDSDVDGDDVTSAAVSAPSSAPAPMPPKSRYEAALDERFRSQLRSSDGGSTAPVAAPRAGTRVTTGCDTNSGTNSGTNRDVVAHGPHAGSSADVDVADVPPGPRPPLLPLAAADDRLRRRDDGVSRSSTSRVPCTSSAGRKPSLDGSVDDGVLDVGAGSRRGEGVDGGDGGDGDDDAEVCGGGYEPTPVSWHQLTSTCGQFSKSYATVDALGLPHSQHPSAIVAALHTATSAASALGANHRIRGDSVSAADAGEVGKAGLFIGRSGRGGGGGGGGGGSGGGGAFVHMLSLSDGDQRRGHWAVPNRCSSGSVGSRSLAAGVDDDVIDNDNDGNGSDDDSVRPSAPLRHSAADGPSFGTEPGGRLASRRASGDTQQSALPSRELLSGESAAGREEDAATERIRHLEEINRALTRRLEEFRDQNVANIRAAQRERDMLLVRDSLMVCVC